MRSHCARRVRWESIKIYCSGGRTTNCITSAWPNLQQVSFACKRLVRPYQSLAHGHGPGMGFKSMRAAPGLDNQMLTGVGLNSSFWARVGLRSFLQA